MLRTPHPRPSNRFNGQLVSLTGILLGLWGIYLLNNLAFAGQWLRFGIQPHTVVGLRGILFAPLLHGSLAHLLTNSLSLAGLGWLVVQQGRVIFWAVTGLTTVTSGMGVWVLGHPGSTHIGASGIVLGYFGFWLMHKGLSRRHSRRWALGSTALGIGLVGLFTSLSPGTSWAAHLFGALGGVLAALLFPRSGPHRILD